ncbi:DUF4097 family beta strand repeat protein [Paenibacillus sp. IB182496]|uniref:DUF4097 family beta strand repeat protein n=1 Tax=Paenibacillus sabuli TaxID=2772509 RepID=A0A927BQD3_9BACL|nr:DUF4097 family beta strand repeat-containing protein [Paenibacillus sabuli]MBD2844812.1 DUF4097 family beta strand repeat protein [Paenibacillus sabuli]
MKRLMGVVLIVAGIVGLVFLFNGGKLSLGSLGGISESFDMGKSVASDEADRLHIEAGSAEVRLVPVSEERVSAELRGSQSGLAIGRKLPELTVQSRSGTIEVNVGSSRGFGITFGRTTLTVEVPSRMWEELRAEAGSGDLVATGLEANVLEIKTGSGDIELTDISAEQGSVSAGSGDVSVEQMTARLLAVETGSGKIELTRLYGGDAQVKTGSGGIEVDGYELLTLTVDASSGNIELEDGLAELNGRAGSGNIDLATDELRRDTMLETGSGNVEVELAREPASLEVRYDGGSGRGRIEWDGFAYDTDERDHDRIRGAFGSGDVLLDVRTGSGNFRLD